MTVRTNTAHTSQQVNTSTSQQGDGFSAGRAEHVDVLTCSTVGLSLRTALLLCSVAAFAVAAGLLSGCAKEEPPPVVTAPPPPPPAPAPPRVKSVAELKEELRIDPRVELAENRAPGTTEARMAVLEFFDAFARSDHRALANMLGDRDRRELQHMVDSGDWERATESITRIEIYQTGPFENRECALALFEVDFDLQPQLWYYERSGAGVPGGAGVPARGSGGFTFRAAPTPPNILGRLSGVDWIASWHEILAEEDQMAMRPDMAVDIPQRVLDEANDPTGAPGGIQPGGPPASPPGDTPPVSPPGGPTPVGEVTSQHVNTSRD